MIKLRYFLFIFLFVSVFCQRAGAEKLLEKEIIYSSDEASEVFMVWGINNWQMPPVEFFPSNSFIKDNLVYTPLNNHGDRSTIKLSLPAGTTLDYVFWITKGVQQTGTDIWDTNQPAKDYHSVYSTV